MNRTILHCDLNCFYASVEMLYYPQFRDVPMAIAGDPKHRHGIILAKNILAKKAGVKTAQTINDALKVCPNLIIRKPNYELYDYFSERLKSLYYEYTDRIEPFGQDECWLDISESIPYFGCYERIVEDLLYRVKNEIGLTLSIGISNNKVYAKLGSDLAKEDDYKLINGLDDIKDLPVNNLLYIGKSVSERLHAYGIYTIKDLANKPKEYLETNFGKWGLLMYEYSNGLDDSEVRRLDDDYEEVKSIGNSMTPNRDIKDIDDFKTVASYLSDNVSSRLKNKNMYFKTVQLSVRNNKLQTKTMRLSLKENTDLKKDIYNCAIKLFNDNCNFNIPIRSIGISVSNLSYEKENIQTSLFEKVNYSYKDKRKEEAIETIRRRFGHNSITSMRIIQDRSLINYDEE